MLMKLWNTCPDGMSLSSIHTDLFLSEDTMLLRVTSVFMMNPGLPYRMAEIEHYKHDSECKHFFLLRLRSVQAILESTIYTQITCARSVCFSDNCCLS